MWQERTAEMNDKHNKSKHALSLRVAEERRLQALLLEHARISEEIIALLSRTSVETERLIRTLEKDSKEPGIRLPIQ